MNNLAPFLTALILITRLSAWDDVKAYDFDITSGTHLEESVVTSLGVADVLFYVNNCSMGADASGITVTKASGGSGSFGIRYFFEKPVDLTQRDFIRIVQTHSGGKNRISGIYLSLPDSKRLELENLGRSPFLDNQNQYALYEFKSSFDFLVHPPKNVLSISIAFDIFSSENVLLEYLSLQNAGDRVHLAAEIELGGTRDLIIRTNREIQSEEIVRLEASNDLVHWFAKSTYSAGSGDVVSFEKYFSDAPFYRLQWHRIVEPVD